MSNQDPKLQALLTPDDVVIELRGIDRANGQEIQRATTARLDPDGSLVFRCFNYSDGGDGYWYETTDEGGPTKLSPDAVNLLHALMPGYC